MVRYGTLHFLKPRRSQGALGAIAHLPQEFKIGRAPKNEGLEGPIPYVLLELLLNEKLQIYRVRKQQSSF